MFLVFTYLLSSRFVCIINITSCCELISAFTDICFIVFYLVYHTTEQVCCDVQLEIFVLSWKYRHKALVE